MLNKSLDCSELRREYEQNNRIRIEQILDDEYAEEIYHCLSTSVEWELFFSGPDYQEVIVSPEQLKEMTPQRRNEIVVFLQAKACREFAYCYFRQKLDSEKYPVLKEFYEGMQSKQFIEFIQLITNERTIDSVSTMATGFQVGNFLRPHDDSTSLSASRLVAHVFGFSKNWRTDWGGMLHFLNDAQDRIIDVQMPGFNTLSLFKVPTNHFVSQVSSYAGASRYSISGWYQHLNEGQRGIT